MYYKASADNHETVEGSFTVTVEKAEVSAPTITGKTYTGETLTADVPSDSRYTVKVNDGGIAVGKYDVVLTLTDTDNYKWKTTDNADITLKFCISGSGNEWTTTPDISGWIYGESANNPIGSAKHGTVVFTYSNEENGDYTSTVPTDAGTYWMKATVESTVDYIGLEKTVSFVIEKARLTDVSVEQTGTLTYNGNEQTPTVSAHATTENGQSVTFTYSTSKDGEYTENVPSFTNAGAYTVYYKASAANHEDAAGSFTVTVNPHVLHKDEDGDGKCDGCGTDIDIPTSPQTGENNNLIFWIVITLLSCGGVIGAALYGKKKKAAER